MGRYMRETDYDGEGRLARMRSAIGKPSSRALLTRSSYVGSSMSGRTRQNPEIAAIGSAHHRSAIVRIKIENPVISLS